MANIMTGQRQNFTFCFLDLNTATEEEIGSVPLIGPSHARELIKRRPFNSFEDVKRVPGISTEQLNALVDAGAVVSQMEVSVAS